MSTRLLPFLDSIEVRFGPKAEIGRYFLMIAEEARQLGVSWHMMGGFERLMDVNRRQVASWDALAPMFDPECSDVNEENTVYIEGQHQGDPVVTLALRRYDWPNSSLKEEWESGRFAYRNPERQRSPSETWTAASVAASRIRGRVAYGGGVWCRRDFRAKRVPVLVMALVRSVPLTLWNPDFTIGVIETGSLSRTLLPLYGNPLSEPGMRVDGGWRNVDCTLTWQTRDEATALILGQVSAAANQPDKGDRGHERVVALRAPR